MRRPLNLLVVDDSALMRALVKRAVHEAGVPLGEINEASNGAEALDVLMRAPIDAIFTDINMPVMTGIELLRMVDRDERWRHVLRVVISTEGPNARRQGDGHPGNWLFVEKPFKPEDIRSVLAALL